MEFKVGIDNNPENPPVEVRLVEECGYVKVKLGSYTIAEFINGTLNFHHYASGSPGLKAMQALGILFTKIGIDRYHITIGGIK